MQNSLTRSAPIPSDAQGRSGARFHTSYNKKYVIKIITSEDVAEMHNILKKYHQVKGRPISFATFDLNTWICLIIIFKGAVLLFGKKCLIEHYRNIDMPLIWLDFVSAFCSRQQMLFVMHTLRNKSTELSHFTVPLLWCAPITYLKSF